MNATLILAGVVWLSAIYRRPTGDRRDASAWALSGTLAALAMGLTLKVPAVYASGDATLGELTLPQLIEDACVVLSACCVVLSAFGTQVLLLHLLQPAGAASKLARRHAVITGLTVTTMTVAFLAARPVAGRQALQAQLAEPGLIEFRGIYLAFLAWVFVDMTRLCWRFSAQAGDRLLAIGLRLIALGGVVGLGYVGSGALQILAAGQHDVSLVQQAQRNSDLLIGLATLLVVVGSVLSPVVTRITARRRRPKTAEAGTPAELQTLWRGLTQELPEFVLPPAARAGLTGREELYRQVIEIEDARRALRPLRSEAIEQAAAQAVSLHGIEDFDREVASEAVALVLTVDRLRTDVTPAGRQADGAAPPNRLASTATTSGNLDWEVGRLARVGRWYDDRALAATGRRLLNSDRDTTCS